MDRVKIAALLSGSLVIAGICLWLYHGQEPEWERFAGGRGVGYIGDGGPAVDAGLEDPMGLAFGSHGDLFIADSGNNVIRRVDTRGIIYTFAGTHKGGFAGDGGPAKAAKFRSP